MEADCHGLILHSYEVLEKQDTLLMANGSHARPIQPCSLKHASASTPRDFRRAENASWSRDEVRSILPNVALLLSRF